MRHRELLLALDPIVLSSNTGYDYHLSDALKEVGSNWELARRNPEIARLDDIAKEQVRG